MLRHALFAATTLALALPTAAQATPCLSAFDTPVFLAGTSTGGPNLLIGIKLVNGPSPVPVLAAEVFTGLVGGANTLAIWSHDPVNNRPMASLGGGGWNGQTTNSWQGANFTTPVILTPNQDFWLVWGMQNGQQITAEQRNTTTGQPYRGSFDNGGSWNGPFVNYDWKYRLWCVPRGQFEVFGSNCAGSNRTRPRMAGSGAPAIGMPFSLLLSSTLPTTPCTVFLGNSDQMWGPAPLPYSLTGLGAPGCFVNVDLAVGAGLTTSATGTASVNFTIAQSPAFVGVTLFAQWLVVDPAANALQLVTSEGARLRIGN